MSHQPDPQPEREAPASSAPESSWPATTAETGPVQSEEPVSGEQPTQSDQAATDAREPGEQQDLAADTLSSTRTSAWWAGVVIFGVLLVLLLVFIAQNTR